MNEELAAVFGRCYGMELVGLRYFNVYGPRQDPDGPYAAVIPRFFKAYAGRRGARRSTATASRAATSPSSPTPWRRTSLAAGAAATAARPRLQRRRRSSATSVNELARGGPRGGRRRTGAALRSRRGPATSGTRRRTSSSPGHGWATVPRRASPRAWRDLWTTTVLSWRPAYDEGQRGGPRSGPLQGVPDRPPHRALQDSARLARLPGQRSGPALASPSPFRRGRRSAVGAARRQLRGPPGRGRRDRRPQRRRERARC